MQHVITSITYKTTHLLKKILIYKKIFLKQFLFKQYFIYENNYTCNSSFKKLYVGNFVIVQKFICEHKFIFSMLRHLLEKEFNLISCLQEYVTNFRSLFINKITCEKSRNFEFFMLHLKQIFTESQHQREKIHLHFIFIQQITRDNNV